MSPGFLHSPLLSPHRNLHSLITPAKPIVEPAESLPVAPAGPPDIQVHPDPAGFRIDPPRPLVASSPAPHGPKPWQPGELRAFAEQFSFVIQPALLDDLQARTKRDAVVAMIQSLSRHGAIPAAIQGELAAAVLKREELGTTGIGAGVAIPHSKYPGLPRVVATLAYSPAGVEFDSLDGEHVHLICLLISPSERPAEHLLALQAISRHLANKDYFSWRSPKRHRGETA